MSWITAKVNAPSGEWGGNRSTTSNLVSVPFDAAVEAGQTIEVDGERFIVDAAVNTANRDEELVLTITEEKPDGRKRKPQKGRDGDKAGEENP